MSEMAKTVVFLAAAAVSLLAAFVVGPSGDNFDVQELVGMRLNQFDVDAPKRLKIIQFDKETASTREFEVAENDGLWRIPSKQGYPADAAKRMAEAATCVIDREVLRIASNSASDHEKLGVVDPGSSKLNSKSQGVGTRVILTGANGETLADMIIGYAVVDAKGQHYVRNADQDVVYVIQIDPDKLSTRFEDWIEKDLLKLNPLDIRKVHIKDYSAELHPVLSQSGFQMQINWDRRGEMTLRYDNEKSTWIPELLQEFKPEEKSLVDYQLAEDEELNQDVLNKLRDGLDDLTIVDVERKPAGLSADLKAGDDFLKNNEAASNLAERGFAPVAISPDGEPEILSTEGELACSMQDGVEYVLRFGNLQMENATAGGNKSKAADAESKDSDDGIHRYLFVMARFNEAMIQRPELKELPSLPEDTEKAKEETAKTSEGAKQAPGKEGDVEEKDAQEESDPPAADEPAEQPSTNVSENVEKEKAEADEDSSGKEAKAEENQGQEEKKEASSELEKIIAQRKSIEKENQRLLDEYQDKVKSGKDRVQELNERFGDWYYVISNDVYEQIHLSRDQVIRKKEKPKDKKDATENTPPKNSPLSGLPNLPLNESAAEAKTQ